MYGEGQRERDSKADPVLNVGLDLRTLGSRPELKPRVRCLTDCATRGLCPHQLVILNKVFTSVSTCCLLTFQRCPETLRAALRTSSGLDLVSAKEVPKVWTLDDTCLVLEACQVRGAPVCTAQVAGPDTRGQRH